MNKDTQDVFIRFIQKATTRIEEKRTEKRRELYVPSIDENITIRSLTKPEIVEVMSMEDNLKADEYTVYLAVVSPNLREVAKTLKENKLISEYVGVVEIFKMSERTQIVKEILELSEVTSDKKVEVVEVLKK